MVLIQFLNKLWLQYVVARPTLETHHRKILKEEFPFYNLLNKEQQKLFERKTRYFMGHKDFVPMKMDVVTDEMKVLISAAAVQLTFGLPFLRLPLFPKILVFPEKFFNKLTGQYHLGEVSKVGVIALSWKDFKKGINNKNNFKNVGLHELAHALQFEDAVMNDEHDFLDVKILKKINLQYLIEKQKLINGEPVYLRKYGLRNAQEFFAVAIEAFFGQPKQMNHKMPELFHLIAELLHLNPLKLLSKKSFLQS